MGMFPVTSFVAGRFYERLGPKLIVTAGAVHVHRGSTALAAGEPRLGAGRAGPGVLVLGVGTGLFYSSVTTAGVTALDPSRAGLAGGIVYMFQVAGGSIGLGLTTAIFTTVTQDRLQAGAAGARLDDSQTEAVDGVLAGTESAARVIAEFESVAGAELPELVRAAFVDGLQWGFRFAAVLALASVVVSAPVVGGEAPRPR